MGVLVRERSAGAVVDVVAVIAEEVGNPRVQGCCERLEVGRTARVGPTRLRMIWK